jgi:hypothetical protein
MLHAHRHLALFGSICTHVAGFRDDRLVTPFPTLFGVAFAAGILKRPYLSELNTELSLRKTKIFLASYLTTVTTSTKLVID